MLTQEQLEVLVVCHCLITAWLFCAMAGLAAHKAARRRARLKYMEERKQHKREERLWAKKKKEDWRDFKNSLRERLNLEAKLRAEGR